MKTIKLTMGYEAVVDDADYAAVSKFKWYAQKNSDNQHNVYARRSFKVGEKQCGQQMHHFILPVHSGLVVDHIDGNGLNNCRSNLRLVSPKSNRINARKVRGKSKFKGVGIRYNGKFSASLRKDGKLIWLGTFENEIDAAKAYDDAALKIFGHELARGNFFGNSAVTENRNVEIRVHIGGQTR